MLSGVPQGSVLGPLLFLIFINNIFDNLLSRESSLHLFADDMLLYKPISSIDDFNKFQSDVNAVANWATRNFLTINTSKTKSMIISRKRQANEFPQLVIDGSTIDQVTSVKYLSITISSNLCWSEHISSIYSKCKSLLA